MKKLLTVLVTFMSVSSALACPGGGLIQVKSFTRDGQVVLLADYNMRTGMRTFLSSRVKSIRAHAPGVDSVCVEAGCEQLIQMQNTEIVQFLIELHGGGFAAVPIKDVTIDQNMAVPKSSPPMMGGVISQLDIGSMSVSDVDGKLILKCSKQD